ncbi:uncharacterized protein BCR38DRAFT_433475 [Pseudomassariella vexata]|uniref:DUF1308 domain-containing protein n=1 Tax=Pseudomassariella vexata TaxID=1141098 RepID=A0A1Y2DXS0_9PEZI|nr:uncharacterized protein BCR38DRAFT_433475 [Pseudomassariella vexata]ORY63926.1 hypothetical protein BCR38DRAFT_433475 [Pseudomassariella vexata]
MIPSQGYQMDFSSEELRRQGEELRSKIHAFADHYRRVVDDISPYGADMVGLMIGPLRTLLENEIQRLEGVIKKSEKETPTRQTFSGSNLPFIEALWNRAEQCENIVAFRKWVSVGLIKEKELLAPGIHIVPSPGDSSRKAQKTIVDIIADDGQTWVKVYTTTSKRLLWDMTKLGWAIGIDEEESDEDESGAGDFDELPIFKCAKDLADAASVHRIRGKHPVVHLVLTRINEGEVKDIDRVLQGIRNLGVNVSCCGGGSNTPPVPLSSETMQRMAPSPFSKFTNVLNIDTSVLIALISDFCHTHVLSKPHFHRMQRDHLANEEKWHMLPCWIYPAIKDHEMVCTKEAVDTCELIVNTLGTETEKARMKLVLSDDPNVSREKIIKEYREMSIYDVPEGFQLPLRVVDGKTAEWQAHLPEEVKQVLEEINNPTKSVFAYGWAEQLTTLTSNGVAISKLTQTLEYLGEGFSDAWPLMWLFPFSRALVGTPKPGRETEPVTVAEERQSGEKTISSRVVEDS